MAETLVTLARKWEDGQMNLERAAKLAARLDFPEKRTDTDGEIWYDGEDANTTAAVYAELSSYRATVFLEATLAAQTD